MKKNALGLVLTWDGARWPVTRLSPKARAFLGNAKALSSAKMAVALHDHAVEEIRICWVPRLKGGRDVLCDPFSTADGHRLSFQLAKTIPFDDVLGAVYRKV